MTENTTPQTVTADMPKADLVKIANDLGIEVPNRWSRARIVEAIQITQEVESKADNATRDGLPTYDVTYVNEAKGGVSAHIAGCKDLDKVGKGNHDEEAGTVTVTSKHDAWLEYNSDFLAEDPSGENAWDIDWKNCAKHVPHHDPLNDTEIATAIADLNNDTKETTVTTETISPKDEVKPTPAETKATKTPVKRVEYTPQGTITAKKEYTVSEAAEVMGMSANAMNHWFRRDYFPTEWVVREGSARKVRVVKGADLKAYVKTRAAEKKAKGKETAKA